MFLDFIRSDRFASLTVWGIWVVMLAMVLQIISRFAKNMPVWEDWDLVAPLTGHEPHLLNWLWSQNGEHRIPLPRVVLLALLKSTHGDFRAGMYFNTILIAFVCALMILAVRTIRGRETKLVDAFFPLTLLNLSHWENFAWSWQLTQVLPTTLILTLSLQLVLRPRLDTPENAVLAGLSVIALPLSGGIGLVFVVLFVAWLSYWGVQNRKGAGANGERIWTGTFLICSAAVSAGLVILYFFNYEDTRYPSSPGTLFTIKLVAQFLSMSAGLFALKFWKISSVVIFGLALTAFWLSAIVVFRANGTERYRALGLCLLLLNFLAVPVVTGFGRAGLMPGYGFPSRYALMFCPILIAIFFIWELYGPVKFRRIVQTAMALGMLSLAPVNYQEGRWWGKGYLERYEAIKPAIEAGTPALVIAEDVREILIHWWSAQQLADHMKMLHDARMTIYADMPDTAFIRPPVRPAVSQSIAKDF